MRVKDLFPICQAVSCPQRGQHKHPLPSQLALIHAAEKYILGVGGYQSGKTFAACCLCLLLMLAIPGNMGFVGRRTYDKLHDSTLRAFLEVLQRAAQVDPTLEGWRALEKFRHFPHRIVLPNESEIIFRETKDVGRHLGPKYGFIYIDELQEEPEDTFTRLKGRLSLPRAQHALKFIGTTNPSHKNHWMYRWFGLEPGALDMKVAGESITYRHIRSSPRDNPHLPPDYVADLLTLDPNEIRRVVEGLPGFVPEGPSVYGEFKHEHHVGVPDLLPTVALVRGWDFGYRHPAGSWSQFYRCKHRTLHLRFLHETDATEVEASHFARRMLDETTRMFPGVPAAQMLDVGDAQGAAPTDKGPGPIVTLGQPPYNLRFRYRKVNDIDPGLELVRKLLRARCECHEPVLLFHRRCRNLIDACAGGYHYPRQAPRTLKDKPVKDGFYDDFADTVRYVVDCIVRAELADPNWLDLLAEAPQAWAVGRPGWAWMTHEPTPEEMAAEIAAVKRRAGLGRPN